MDQWKIDKQTLFVIAKAHQVRKTRATPSQLNHLNDEKLHNLIGMKNAKRKRIRD